MGKGLLCKHEDPSLDPQYLHKYEHVGICSYHSSSKEAKTDPRGLLASQSHQTGALQVHEEDCLKKTKKQIRITVEGDTQC